MTIDPQKLTQNQENPQNQEQKIGAEAKVEVPAGFQVEKRPEMAPAQEFKEPAVIEEKKEQIETVAPAVSAPLPTAPAKSDTLEKIEDILEEDLEAVYFQMPPEKQQEFQKAGVETATKIESLLKDVKVKIRKILALIKSWLKIIPGINKFFLEQEAKIKADKILEIKEKQQSNPEIQEKNKI